MNIDAKTNKKEVLKGIIRDLHRGGDVEELRKRFADLLSHISAGEIAAMEQELISEGLPEEEIKKLCDVHVRVFKDSLENQPASSHVPGHPLHTLAAENRELEKIVARTRDRLALDTGVLSAEQVNLLLTNLPVDISFVDENDTVVYYSATRERIFPRTPGVIGRKVQNCHPPKSLDTVTQILAAFRDGSRDVAEFWIEMNGKFVHIRYFALRDNAGKYRGSLEVSQDVTGIRALRGEKRLLDWDPKGLDV